MGKMSRRVLVLAGLAAALACGRGPDPAPPVEAAPPASPSGPAFDSDAFTRAVDAVAQAALEKGPVVGLSIAVARGPDVLLAKGYGMADREAGVPAAEAVYVGDLYSVDVLGARAAGLDGILLDPRGFWGPRDCRLAAGLSEAVRLALQDGKVT